MNRQTTMFALVAFAGAMALLDACSGDDHASTDAGDASPDDQSAPDVVDAPDGYFTADCCIKPPTNPFPAYVAQVANACCGRLQACCGGADAGFDYNACVTQLGLLGWQSSNADLQSPGVMDGGRLSLDQAAANSCTAGLASLSCPVVSAAEFKALTTSCMAAIMGTGGVGAPCRVDSECQATEYCDTPADGGPSTCAALLTQGALCGQTPPWFVEGSTYRSDQCAYKGGPAPALFCDYDSDPDASGFMCQPVRAADAGCRSNNECASGICDSTSRECTTSFAVSTLCQAFVSGDM